MCLLEAIDDRMHVSTSLVCPEASDALPPVAIATWRGASENPSWRQHGDGRIDAMQMRPALL